MYIYTSRKNDWTKEFLNIFIWNIAVHEDAAEKNAWYDVGSIYIIY